MKKTLIATLMSAGLLLAPLAVAAEPEFAHLETVGVGEVTASPDTAILHVEVVITKDNAKKAKQGSDKAVAELLARLERQGVARKNIQSANISLQPQYRYQKNKEPELTGYRASRQVTVTLSDISSVNTVLDGALDDGINRINSIELKASNEAELKVAARNAAIKDAKQKAGSLAKGFGESIKGVWKIRYFDHTPVRPVMMRAAEAMVADVDATYQDSEIKIQDRVEVIFRLTE